MTTPPILVFDGHNDVLLKLMEDPDYDFFARNAVNHLDYERAQAGGFAGGFFALFVPPTSDQREAFLKAMEADPNTAPMPDPLELAYAQATGMAMAARLLRLERASGGRFKIVRTVADLESCLREGTMAAIFHMEGAEAIDPDLDALEVFYQAGLRSLGPVWSRHNVFAQGVPFKFPGSPDTGDGLTEAGKRLVRRCNELGILIDLSHMNERGFWDVAAISEAPLVATHSNVHALSASTRNLTDAQLDAIKASDGMVGLNFAVGFLRDDGDHNNTDLPLEVMVRHLDYLVARLGVERVGLGSDFDGASIPQAIGDVSGLPKLFDALRSAGYDEATLRKLGHENWLRVLRLTWKD